MEVGWRAKSEKKIGDVENIADGLHAELLLSFESLKSVAGPFLHQP